MERPALAAAGDLTAREVVVFGVLVLGLLWLGLHPQPVLDAARPALESMQQGLLQESMR